MERADVSDDKPIVCLCAGVGLRGRLRAGAVGKFAEAGARRRENR